MVLLMRLVSVCRSTAREGNFIAARVGSGVAEKRARAHAAITPREMLYPDRKIAAQR
jgi:hypothetical protein